ncbi:hypothetical protein B9Z55_017676 [Caenorhabditis nigoni]|uniref:Extracellular Endonuclease subunit A domain-containing protein n=1 Tax=Caenorhabditis nigoni TaxID=1611254 RepID=A0A2G5TA58_9PELO|nr:hypothetical protein B9Z55_017676 [Caenorhabditis nigoni]
MVVIGIIVLFLTQLKAANAKYEWKGCHNVGKCELSGYDKPPLVIMSLDGFAREYLDRDIVLTLNHIAECGVKADKVYPSFPSKTFPNHYSIVTGLWPESHGITDNSVFDPTVSPVLESMARTKQSKFFEGEPVSVLQEFKKNEEGFQIWSVYKRTTGKKANCLFWIGCAHNSSGFGPDVSPAYNQGLPFKDRIDIVVDWLKLPADERPGLITAYLHEPDEAGHYQVNDEDVDEKLAEIDDNLDYLMSRLKNEKLLECINFAILSDHGMQLLDKTYYFQDYLDLNGIITAKGVVGRFYMNNTDISVNDVADQIQCKIDTVKVNTRADMPTRKHYSRSSRVGEVLLEGRPGITFYQSKEDDYKVTADHGYDYIHPKMHTIFYARGPSFKQNKTISSYQNVQYMNLWMSLLGIEGAVETNGTLGFFDNVLYNPTTKENPKNVIGECPMVAYPFALRCSGYALPTTMDALSSKLTSCDFSPSTLPLYSDNHCYHNYCGNSVIASTNAEDKRRAIIEILYRDESSTPLNFTYVNAKYQWSCPNPIANASLLVRSNSGKSLQLVLTGFSLLHSEFSSVADTRLELPNNFVLKVLEPLRAKSLQYLKKYETLYVITGTATDLNHDGVADSDSSIITHIYRILLICNSDWLSLNPPLCFDPEAMQTLSFIFPITERSTVDCMNYNDILLDYTATIYDVERIAGFQFGIGELTQHENTIIRQNITTRLW